MSKKKTKRTQKEYEYRKTFTVDGIPCDVKADTELELGEKIAKKTQQIREGRIIISPKMKVKEWAETWIDTYVVKTVGSDTLKNYHGRLNNHILPVIGNMCMKDVRDIHVQEILNRMEGSSKDYIGKVNNTLYQMFKKAKKNKLTYENPADDLEMPVAEDGEGRPVTMQERQTILKVAEQHRGGLWVRTMIECGFRPSETERFLEAHINYKAKIIYIDGTKSAAAKRYVPVSDSLLEEFKALNREPFDPIFQNTLGGKLSKSCRSTLWNNFKREMNIELGCRVYRNQLLPPYMVAEDLIPYCMRHTFATDLKDALVPDAIRKELLGHSNRDVTDRYSHRTETSIEIARDLLEKFRTRQEEALFDGAPSDGTLPIFQRY